ncbi:MAG: hypothetical protein LUD43_04785 [Firmicutes bacterium]|nr:hypothetical protein [Bacillota bacterium]
MFESAGKSSKGIMTGLVIGSTIGAAVGAASASMMPTKKKKLKKSASHAIDAVGTMMHNISEWMS